MRLWRTVATKETNIDVATVGLLARYNKKTNEDMNVFLEPLTDKQWRHPFVGYYPNILSLCNHLYIADFNWLKRFQNLRDFSYRQAPLFENSYTFDMNVVEPRGYASMRKELDELLLKLADEVTSEDFEQTLKWKNFRDEDQARQFGGVLLHMFNHQTHHRGMISVYLEHLGKDNDYSNLLFMV